MSARGWLAFALSVACFAMVAADGQAQDSEGCVRGKFKNYYNEGKSGYDPADFGWTGRVFELSQDYPDTLPPKEDYPWLAIPFENGGPTDPEAYLRALLAYGLEGNVDVDFYVEDNTIRHWYSMPWMDWNTEVDSDWPGTDGREFVHGLTHEFDSSVGTLSEMQTQYVDTWSGAYYNDRASYGIGQVWCDPNDPDLDQLNPDPTARNYFPDGGYIIKLLFSTVTDEQLPTMKNSLAWDANIMINQDPDDRNDGPLAKFQRGMRQVRLLQIDVAVRDSRSLTGWLFGTFGYDGRVEGATPWDRMVPLGIQWGNNPGVTYDQSCPSGVTTECDFSKLTQQWINLNAVLELASPPLNFDHLGFGGRLAGPVDNSEASCMGCHQTAGFPPAPLLPEFAPGWEDRLAPDGQDLSWLDQAYRLTYQQNARSGVVFSPAQLATADYSLQLSMSLMNFVSLECRRNRPGSPKICSDLVSYVSDQTAALQELFVYGVPGRDGGPISPQTAVRGRSMSKDTN